jgi:hypothetical protein
MLIANPIYDAAFKRLMENERIAKFFISTLIEQEVVSLEVKPQEYSHTHTPSANDKPKIEPFSIQISIYRADFVAVIKTDSGEHKKILIEVQKLLHAVDVMRFRRYLADQYSRQDIVAGKTKALPITTIYVVDFPLVEIKSPCIKVGRTYIDLVDNHKVLECEKNEFIECLTHDCFVVQTQRINDSRLNSKLAELLSVFEQNNFVDGAGAHIKEYLHTPKNAVVKQIINELVFVASDKDKRKELEDEREFMRIMEVYFGEQWENFSKVSEMLAKRTEMLAQTEIELAKQKEQNAQKETELAQTEATLAQKEATLAQKEAELAQQIAENERIKKIMEETKK